MTPLIDDLPFSYSQHTTTQKINKSASTSLYVPIVLTLNGIDTMDWCHDNPKNRISCKIRAYTKQLTQEQYRLLQVLQAWILKRICDTNFHSLSINAIRRFMEEDDTMLGKTVRHYLHEPDNAGLCLMFRKNGLLRVHYIKLILSSIAYRLGGKIEISVVNDVLLRILLNGYLKYPLYEYTSSISEWLEAC